jgi:Domain of unknown function (DUF4388)
MGLEGTLGSFSVPDVFQVLGLQRKTGILTVEGPQDTITVSFLGGQIVAANSLARSLEDRVGTLLVGSGRLAPGRLLTAFQARKETGERLVVQLLRHRQVSGEEMGEALRLQICRIILEAFRWTEGKFRFSQEGVIDQDAAVLSPIPTDALLREAAERREEWPRLEGRVPSPDVVYRRAPGVERLRLVLSSEEAGAGALFVSRREAETWTWVDGKRRVGEILERAFLSDLDVYRGLADLLDRNLIAQALIHRDSVQEKAPRKTARISARAIGLWAVLLVLAAASVRRIPQNPSSLLLRPARESQEVSDLLKAVSLSRLASLERAVRVYYDSSGQYPTSLEDLLGSGVLTREGATDPYGRPYRYILRAQEGKYSLYGRNARGDIDLDLTFERSLAPVSESRPPNPATRPDKRPGVQVIQ